MARHSERGEVMAYLIATIVVMILGAFGFGYFAGYNRAIIRWHLKRNDSPE